jgi:hypothetical protein
MFGLIQLYDLLGEPPTFGTEIFKRVMDRKK